ncbi:MAG: hypothetical protein B5M51_02770 [Anaerolinea sp. 4484_236]|nr:MAG: hypothetical protein B5M51_02770 [Anaerolinea sp. 4484_236]
MNITKQHKIASIKTANNLKTVATKPRIQQASRLSLPEIEAVTELIAQIVPAGNVPGVVLNGLARLSGKAIPPKSIKRDIDLLFKGVEQTLDKAVYSAVFAGPAAVIWGYQNLLKLVGKRPDDAFPEGVWQFYIEYALRNDTSHHTNETHGFDTALRQHQIQLTPVDRLTAWAMTSIHLLHHYNAILENEWRERIYTRLLRDITAKHSGHKHYTNVYRTWQQFIPYKRGADAASTEPYHQYRRQKFDKFIQTITTDLPASLRKEWHTQIHIAERNWLPAYQQQMSILSYLNAGRYGELRTHIPLAKAQLGLISGGNYYLMPICVPGSTRPVHVRTVRSQIAALFQTPQTDCPSEGLRELACIRRASWPNLRKQLTPALTQALNTLRLAPILLNADPRPYHLPLAELRQTERGIGDHPLTIFDTGQTFVFDQSHIFFDGTWGAGLAEILTNEALAWAVYLEQMPPVSTVGKRPYHVQINFQTKDLQAISTAPRIPAEASAESDQANIKAIVGLRKLLKRRSDLLGLTVNDLLVLYRGLHAVTYKPKLELLSALEALKKHAASQSAAKAALTAITQTSQINPPILIPIDASQHNPANRLYPLVFEVPLAELDLLNLHQYTVATLTAYKTANAERTAQYAQFDQLQRTYLAALAGFGEVLSRYINIALQGESTSVGAIKMVAHLPVAIQRLLDRVPHKLDMLNDLIKGREVFSNVGAVVPSSTLTRFITAKDDNDKKTLVWGIITDAKNIMRISLRDFRPHVEMLEAIGRRDLALQIVEDYLEAYANGLNQFISELYHITVSSRETTMLGGSHVR